MEKEYIITVRNTYLVKADVDEDNPTLSKKNYNEYIEFKIANVLITIFFPIRLFIKLFIFLDKKFPRLFEYPKRSLKHIDNIMNFIYPLAMYGLCAIYAIAYSARTAHPFQRNGAPFRFKLSKTQQVD